MLGFQSCEQRADKCSLTSMLTLCEAYNFRPRGESVMDWHRRSVGDSGPAKIRSKVAAVTAQFLDVDWAKLLPADAMPATVDVHRDGTTIPVPSSPIITPVPLSPVTSDRLREFQRGLVHL